MVMANRAKLAALLCIISVRAPADVAEDTSQAAPGAPETIVVTAQKRDSVVGCAARIRR